MQSIFEKVWADLQSSLRPGQKIDYWSRDGQTRGGQFEISDVKQDIIIILNKTKKTQRINKKAFFQIFENWEPYINGSIARHELKDTNRYTSYIISIFHCNEQHDNLRINK